MTISRISRGGSAPAAAKAPSSAPAAGAQNQLFITGSTTEAVNAALKGKGTAQPVKGGLVVNPPFDLETAMSLSSSLKKEGFKVVIRRAKAAPGVVLSMLHHTAPREGERSSTWCASAAILTGPRPSKCGASSRRRDIQGFSCRARPADGRRSDAVDRGGVTALTKNDLINAVAAHGLSKRQSASVVESLFDIIFRCFEKSEDVKIVGFGHFRIRRKASRRGRNPQTGDSIEITARKVLTFKPSKGLKQRINQQS